MGLDGPAYARNADAVTRDIGGGVGYPGVGAVVDTHSRSPFDPGDLWEEPQWHRPDPSIGGRTGAVNVLGFSTGFVGPNGRRARFTGRTIVPPPPAVNPAFGPVGRDNRASKLAAGVEQQQTDYMPDILTIARSFTTRGGRAAANAAGDGT